jgi:threonine/homoserine/homoserine lactone efflux protein
MTGAHVPASLSAGIILGLSAGLSPGPLMALVISHTVRHGVREGVKVSLAPLATDLPIVLICMFLLKQLPDSNSVLGCISLLGGIFVLYLGYESFKTNTLHVEVEAGSPQSLGKGILVNILSPHPYLFWLTVGAPMMLKAWTQNPLASLAFAIGFYVCLVGAKISMAVILGRSRRHLGGRPYGYFMRMLGLLLIAFACILFKEGFHLLGWLS